jgi:hypothetical protein
VHQTLLESKILKYKKIRRNVGMMVHAGSVSKAVFTDKQILTEARDINNARRTWRFTVLARCGVFRGRLLSCQNNNSGEHHQKDKAATSVQGV